MLATVLTKTLRDRWKGEVIAAFSLAVMFLLGMAVYRDIDLSVYTDLPEVFRSLMNIPADADVGALAYGAVYASYGALTLSALALAMGSAAIAGEERDGTMGLLLGNPKSRTHVVVSKGATIVLLTALGSVMLWAGGMIVPAALDVDITGIHVGALLLHTFVIAVFHGFLALAVSAWTGRSSLATGLTVAVMVLSFFAVGWLPLIEGLEGGVRAFPWHYYIGSQPHLNGTDWGDLAVLLLGVAGLAGSAVVGVNRRDLRGQASGEGLIGRLRAHPLTRQGVERLAGSTRVSKIWTKTASEHQGMLIVVSGVMFLVMGVVLGPMYSFIDETLVDLGGAFPEGVMELFGGGDLSTPEGWYQIETFGLMAPVAFMLVTVTIGARALAGEEGKRTMGLLLANPVRRSTVVLQTTLAMVVHAGVVAVALAAGVIIGSVFGGLGMSWANIVATSLHAALVGLVFGAVALAISAGSGRVRLAVFGTIGAALVSFVVDGFLPLSDRFAELARLTPLYYYLTSDPLTNGLHWGHAAVLAGLTGALVWVAVILFDRRDLRQTA